MPGGQNHGGRQPKLTVVIPARNAAATIGAQLDALAAQEWSEPWEVVVVDNGSTDGTAAVVETYRGRLPSLRVVVEPRRGQARALNTGVRAAAADAVAFCDADDEVAAGWVSAMGEALAGHPLVACSADDEKLNDGWQRAARAAPEPGRLATVLFLPHIPYAGSGGLGVQREVHRDLGGFDESMAALFDVDYCIRAYREGHELRLVEEAVIHYRYRLSWRGIFDQAKLYGRLNAYLQHKHADIALRPSGLRWLLGGWKPIVRALPRVRSRSGRAKLAWLLGWQLGRYAGSLRYRVLAL
jgi:glycosyltransferase involved in cell wall biosynthesis